MFIRHWFIKTCKTSFKNYSINKHWGIKLIQWFQIWQGWCYPFRFSPGLCTLHHHSHQLNYEFRKKFLHHRKIYIIHLLIYYSIEQQPRRNSSYCYFPLFIPLRGACQTKGVFSFTFLNLLPTLSFHSAPFALMRIILIRHSNQECTKRGFYSTLLMLRAKCHL